MAAIWDRSTLTVYGSECLRGARDDEFIWHHGSLCAWRGGSLAEWAAGGYLYITGDPSREPLCGPEHLCGYVGGYTAAIAVQAGSILRQRTGRGSHIDVSVMAAMLSMHQSTFSRLGVGIIRRGPVVTPRSIH